MTVIRQVCLRGGGVRSFASLLLFLHAVVINRSELDRPQTSGVQLKSETASVVMKDQVVFSDIHTFLFRLCFLETHRTAQTWFVH